MRIRFHGAALMLFATVVVALPLTFCPLATQVFELPKFVVLIVFALLLFISTHRTHAHRSSNTAVTLLSVLFLMSAAISTAMSAGMLTSLIGSPERHMGLVTFIAFAILAMTVMRLHLSPREQLQYVVAPTIVVGCMESLIACVQYFHPHLLFSFLDVSEMGERSFGTFGHPNFLAAYLIVPFLFALTLCLPSKRSSVMIAAVSLLGFGIASTGSRAALLGVAAGALLLFIFGQTRMGRLKLLLTLAFIALLLLSTWGHRGLGGADSASIRLQIWSVVPSAFSAHPIFGIGLENFWLAFKSVEPASLAMRFPETVIDRSHNAVLDLLVETGIVGTTLAFASLIALACAAYRGPRTTLRASYAAAIVALLVTWQFGFPTITDGTFFVLCAALLTTIPSENSPGMTA